MKLVSFEGGGPFSLPQIQTVEATAQGANVAVALSVLVDGDLAVVWASMTPDIAVQLLEHLPLAIAATQSAR